jgi:hypothetical protein
MARPKPSPEWTNGLVRDPEWLDESGGAEFPEALPGAHRFVGYISATGFSDRPVWRAV